TTWLWLESGSRHWADPYQVNCDDIGQPAQWKTGRHCQGALMQSSGFQAWDRQNDYVKEFKRFYTENDLKKVLSDALENSKKAAEPEWNYHDSKALVEGQPNYIQQLKDE